MKTKKQRIRSYITETLSVLFCALFLTLIYEVTLTSRAFAKDNTVKIIIPMTTKFAGKQQLETIGNTQIPFQELEPEPVPEVNDCIEGEIPVPIQHAPAEYAGWTKCCPQVTGQTAVWNPNFNDAICCLSYDGQFLDCCPSERLGIKKNGSIMCCNDDEWFIIDDCCHKDNTYPIDGYNFENGIACCDTAVVEQANLFICCPKKRYHKYDDGSWVCCNDGEVFDTHLGECCEPIAKDIPFCCIPGDDTTLPLDPIENGGGGGGGSGYDPGIGGDNGSDSGYDPGNGSGSTDGSSGGNDSNIDTCCPPERIYRDGGKVGCCPAGTKPTGILGEDKNQGCCDAKTEGVFAYRDGNKTHCCTDVRFYYENNKPQCCPGKEQKAHLNPKTNTWACCIDEEFNEKEGICCPEGGKYIDGECCEAGHDYSTDTGSKACCENSTTVLGAEDQKHCCPKEGQTAYINNIYSVRCCDTEPFKLSQQRETWSCCKEGEEHHQLLGAPDGYNKCCPIGEIPYLSNVFPSETKVGTVFDCCGDIKKDGEIIHRNPVQIKNFPPGEEPAKGFTRYNCCREDEPIATIWGCCTEDRTYYDGTFCCNEGTLPVTKSYTDDDGTEISDTTCCPEGVEDTHWKPIIGSTDLELKCCKEDQFVEEIIGVPDKYICCSEQNGEKPTGAILNGNGQGECCYHRIIFNEDKFGKCCKATEDGYYNHEQKKYDCCEKEQTVDRTFKGYQECCEDEKYPADVFVDEKVKKQNFDLPKEFQTCCSKGNGNEEKEEAFWSEEKNEPVCCRPSRMYRDPEAGGILKCCDGEVSKDGKCCPNGGEFKPVEGAPEGTTLCCGANERAYEVGGLFGSACCHEYKQILSVTDDEGNTFRACCNEGEVPVLEIPDHGPVCCHRIDGCAEMSENCKCEACKQEYELSNGKCIEVNCKPGQVFTQGCGCHDLCSSCEEYSAGTCQCESVPAKSKGIGELEGVIGACNCDDVYLYANGGCVPKDLECHGEQTYCHKNKGGVQCCSRTECSHPDVVCYAP